MPAAVTEPRPLRLARLLARQGRLDEAEAVLEQATSDAAASPATAAELARLLQAQRRYGGAEVRWRAALQAAPQEQAALQGLLRALRLQRRVRGCAWGDRGWPGAIAELAHAPRRGRPARGGARGLSERQSSTTVRWPCPARPPRLLNELAEVQVARHRFAAAEAILRRLIAASPARPRGGSPWPRRRRGARRSRSRARALDRGPQRRRPAPASTDRDRAAARRAGQVARGRAGLPRSRRDCTRPRPIRSWSSGEWPWPRPMPRPPRHGSSEGWRSHRTIGGPCPAWCAPWRCSIALPTRGRWPSAP